MKVFRIILFFVQSYALGLLFCTVLGFLLGQPTRVILHNSFIAFPFTIVLYFVLRFGQDP